MLARENVGIVSAFLACRTPLTLRRKKESGYCRAYLQIWIGDLKKEKLSIGIYL